ncbi:hypothetical protein Syun_012146 [Stephania yunnanensis]|uniref:Uncharacterized protein n=1 Tax=Stephania yunnanensis TaxID=152371 RepID=A0AAP0JYW9_9MAGN
MWYMRNIYLIAKKRITPIYLTDEVFEHYKRMRATDEAFKKKSEQMSTNKKSEVGGSATGVGRALAGTPKVARNIAEGANGKTRTNVERQNGTPSRKWRDVGLTPPSPVTKRSGPQSDDQPGHLTMEITPF